MKKVYALCGATGIIKMFSSKSKAETMAKTENFQTNSDCYYVEVYEVE